MYQKCPICSGSGTITTAMSTASTCPTCNGKRIICELTGMPPQEPEVQVHIPPKHLGMMIRKENPPIGFNEILEHNRSKNK